MKTESQKELRFIPANEVTKPVHFPKVYKTREGRTIVYLGAILEERENMTIRCSPFWAEGRHSVDEDISKTIKGFYRLKNGIVLEIVLEIVLSIAGHFLLSMLQRRMNTSTFQIVPQHITEYALMCRKKKTKRLPERPLV